MVVQKEIISKEKTIKELITKLKQQKEGKNEGSILCEVPMVEVNSKLYDKLWGRADNLHPTHRPNKD